MEFEDKYDFAEAGLSEYMVYCNPANEKQWKERRQKGVDKIFKIGLHTFYIEESFVSHFYYYRKDWFINSRLPRFKDCHVDKYHHRIILTNGKSNYQQLSEWAKFFDIFIMDIAELISLLLRYVYDYIVNQLSNTNNSNYNNSVYASNSNFIIDSELEKQFNDAVVKLMHNEDLTRLRSTLGSIGEAFE